MEIGLLIAIGFALAFALTNGFHDASNAIATLVATRGATAGQAVVLSAVFNMAGAVLLGTAVADTIGKIVTVPQTQMVAVVGAGLAGATVWNLLTWWYGIPSSSSHASMPPAREPTTRTAPPRPRGPPVSPNRTAARRSSPSPSR